MHKHWAGSLQQTAQTMTGRHSANWYSAQVVPPLSSAHPLSDPPASPLHNRSTSTLPASTLATSPRCRHVLACVPVAPALTQTVHVPHASEGGCRVPQCQGPPDKPPHRRVHLSERRGDVTGCLHRLSLGELGFSQHLHAMSMAVVTRCEQTFEVKGSNIVVAVGTRPLLPDVPGVKEYCITRWGARCCWGLLALSTAAHTLSVLMAPAQ